MQREVLKHLILLHASTVWTGEWYRRQGQAALHGWMDVEVMMSSGVKFATKVLGSNVHMTHRRNSLG